MKRNSPLGRLRGNQFRRFDESSIQVHFPDIVPDVSSVEMRELEDVTDERLQVA